MLAKNAERSGAPLTEVVMPIRKADASMPRFLFALLILSTLVLLPGCKGKATAPSGGNVVFDSWFEHTDLGNNYYRTSGYCKNAGSGTAYHVYSEYNVSAISPSEIAPQQRGTFSIVLQSSSYPSVPKFFWSNAP